MFDHKKRRVKDCLSYVWIESMADDVAMDSFISQVGHKTRCLRHRGDTWIKKKRQIDGFFALLY